MLTETPIDGRSEPDPVKIVSDMTAITTISTLQKGLLALGIVSKHTHVVFEVKPCNINHNTEKQCTWKTTFVELPDCRNSQDRVARPQCPDIDKHKIVTHSCSRRTLHADEQSRETKKSLNWLFQRCHIDTCS